MRGRLLNFDKKDKVAEEPCPIPPDIVGLKCVGCWDRAEGLFQGTSYCAMCLKEAIRTGKA